MVQFFEKLAKHLLVWGSEPVIAAVNRWRALAALDGGGPDSLFAYEDLLFAIREDIGNRKDLQRGDLLRVFVNDIDDFLSPRKDDAGDDDLRLAA